MYKLLLGSFSAISLSLAGNFSSAPELVERARGSATKHFDFSTIHAENGIDRSEAFTIAESEILGAIDLQRFPVQSYDRPKKDGDFWRINVFVKTSKGLKNRPILVDSITGASNGEGVHDNWRDSWFNNGGIPVNLGSSHYRIERDRIANSLSVEVTLNRETERNDLKARKECYRDTVRAIAKIKQGFPAKFEDVPLTAIVMSEWSVSDTHSRKDRQWVAKFPLIRKNSVRSYKP
jgi:hypothetical protein